LASITGSTESVIHGTDCGFSFSRFVIGVQVGAHHKIDVVDRHSCRHQTFFKTIAVQHVPEWARRSRLMVADAGVDQNVVARRLDHEALDAEHQPILDIDKFRLQPVPIFVKLFFGKFGKETQCVKKSALLLDHRVDGDFAQRQWGCHGEALL
jgi:hypothetical protein